MVHVECDMLQMLNSTMQARDLAIEVQSVATVDPTSSLLFERNANITFHMGATISVMACLLAGVVGVAILF